MAEKIASLIVDIGAQVANLQKGLDQATGMIQRFGSTSKSLVQGVGQGIGQGLARGIGSAIGNLPGVISDLVHKGEELGSIADAFSDLGGASSSIEQAKTATLGLVSSFDLMKIANEGLIRQIPELNKNFSTFADYAARFADATGGDTKAAIEGLIGAIAAGKPKMLEQYGIIIDTEKAYHAYADAHRLAADSLTKLQQKEAIQVAAVDAVNKKLKETKPIGDSVANAMDAVGVSFGEVTGKLGMVINENKGATEAFRNLDKAISGIDLDQLGNSLATVIQRMVDAAASGIPKVIGWFNDLVYQARAASMVLDELAKTPLNPFDAMERGQNRAFTEALANTKQEFIATLNELKKLPSADQFLSTGKTRKDLDEILPKVSKLQAIISSPLGKEAGLERYADSVSQAQRNVDTLGKLLPTTAQGLQHTGDVGDEAGKKAAAAAKKIADEAKKAAEEVAKLSKQWDETFRSLSEQMLDEEINLEIKSIELGGAGKQLDELIAEKTKAIGEKLTPELKDAVEKGVLTPAQADKYKEIMIARGIQPVADARWEAEQENDQKIADDYKKKMDEALDDIESGLGDIAKHFGFDFGKELSTIFDSKMVQDALGGFFKEMDGLLGLEAGNFASYLGTALDVVGDALSAKELDKKTKSNQGTGKAIGGGIGAAIGGALGGSEGAKIGKSIGNVIGQTVGGFFKWGPSNPETKARHMFANWLEDQFKKLGEVSFKDAQGKVHTFMGDKFNFIEGATNKFNSGEWEKKFATWGKQAEGVFKGLGQALEETLGLTEEVGNQIGFLLAENLAGDVDNARMLVQQLGLDMQSMIDALVEAGVRGEMSWLEVQSAINGVTTAFGPGLVAVGAFSAAFDNIVSSAGQGFDAVKAVKDIAIEASEAGITSLDQLQQQLIAAGKDPAEVKSLFAALQAAGLTSIQAIADASTQTLGSVIANMEAGNTSLAEKWKDMRKEIEGVGDAIKSLPDEKEIVLRVKTETDDKTDEVLSKLGEKSIEGESQGHVGVDLTKEKQQGVKLASIRSVGGHTPSMERLKENGGRSVIYNIDARNAAPGVEESILRALRDAEDRAVTRTLEIVASSN